MGLEKKTRYIKLVMILIIKMEEILIAINWFGQDDRRYKLGYEFAKRYYRTKDLGEKEEIFIALREISGLAEIFNPIPIEYWNSIIDPEENTLYYYGKKV